MSRKQIMFHTLSPRKENMNCKSFTRECLSDNSGVTRSITFNDEDSRDSGFESHDSENETSPGVVLRNTNSSVRARRSLFSGKRSRDEERGFYSKKQRKADVTSPNSCQDSEVTSETMKTAVERLDTETGLVGDGSRMHRLPTVTGRHKDLKSVSPHTLGQLLEGQFDDVISGYQIIDCRYPYEYEGGHIEGAVNLHTEAMITDFITRLRNSDCTNRNILIFHCEFSSQRGPKLLRHLRSMDRKLNSDRYPFLFYPEVYLLDGGYKAFYEENMIRCVPRSYVPMLHEDFSRQLRHFRVKSKSWTAGDKQNKRRQRRHTEISPVKTCLL